MGSSSAKGQPKPMLPKSRFLNALRLSSSRKGQAFVEYLLFTALSLGVVVGVLYPLFQERLGIIQDRILSQGQSVVAQTQMGIPYCWFFCESGSGFADLDARLAAADASRQNAEGANLSGGPGGGPTGESGDGSDQADEAGTGPGGGVGSGPRVRSSGAGLGTAGSSAPPEAENAEEDPRRPRGAAGSQASSGGGNLSGETTGGSSAGETNLASGEDSPEVEAGGDGALGRNRRLGQASEENRSGCRSFNFYTLLKIVAVIGILLLLGGVALTNRRNKNP